MCMKTAAAAAWCINNIAQQKIIQEFLFGLERKILWIFQEVVEGINNKSSVSGGGDGGLGGFSLPGILAFGS